jgi:serine/threonine protein phosphatase PrpC
MDVEVGAIVDGRYRIDRPLAVRGPVHRYQGVDLNRLDQPKPVIIIRQSVPSTQDVPTPPTLQTPPLGSNWDRPVSEDTAPATDKLASAMTWPGILWEEFILSRATHGCIPCILDTIITESDCYLIEAVPTGLPLQKAWWLPGVTWRLRCTWLIQIAQGLQEFHRAGAIFEELKPEMFVISEIGDLLFADVNGLLPFPLPTDTSVRGTLNSAPELVLNAMGVDARADLYAFGALLYTLLLNRPLADADFALDGQPRPYIERFPDTNPLLGRVLAKTFNIPLFLRFPTEDGKENDPSGLTELIESLEECGRNLDRHRLDIAAWTSTGMIRTGNEDAVSILNGNDGRLGESDSYALVVLADGMGGQASGEVAAAMAIQSIRQTLIETPPFVSWQTDGIAVLRPDEAEGLTPLPSNSYETLLPPELFASEGLMIRPNDREGEARSPKAYCNRLDDALRVANNQIYEASQSGFGNRGMGCTVEVLLIDGAQAVYGHVGDSRLYHQHQGVLKLLTSDHTVIQRMIELGQLTPEGAARHPRRAELYQALGGRSLLQPQIGRILLSEGDWLLACSDGLTNQISEESIQSILREAPTAEKAARWLINLALLEGAADNVTVAVVRIS